MKIGFYDPYFDALGGGERYTLTIASHWGKRNEVFIFWDNPEIISQAEIRFGLDLSGVQCTPNVFATNKFFTKLAVSKQYDLIFFLSDGSIPTSFAKRNILHFQVPFPKVDINPFKLGRYQVVVCNSEFTKNNLDRRLRGKTQVIYPPVKPIPTSSDLKKDNLILSVGRFTDYHEVKKQGAMIKAFKKIKSKLKGWELVLAGGLMPDDKNYFRSLLRESQGHKIKLITNATYKDLVKYYQRARIYWHAAGFEQTDPRLMEHFGISTVEAMSAGAVPLTFAGGGQPEIIKDGTNGYLWTTLDQLSEKTISLIENKKTLEKLSKMAVARAKDFGEIRFKEAFDNLLKQVR